MIFLVMVTWNRSKRDGMAIYTTVEGKHPTEKFLCETEEDSDGMHVAHSEEAIEIENESSSETDSGAVIEEIQDNSSTTVIVGTIMIDANDVTESRQNVQQVELETNENREKEVVEIIEVLETENMSSSNSSGKSSLSIRNIQQRTMDSFFGTKITQAPRVSTYELVGVAILTQDEVAKKVMSIEDSSLT